MYTVFLKGDSSICQSGFESWADAYQWGRENYGPRNFEIVIE